MSKKVKNQFPEGWDEAKVKDVIDYYENQTDEEAAAEIENAPLSNVITMRVPKELKAKVEKLIDEFYNEQKAV